MGVSRSDLNAESLIGSMSQLMLTPEYFCSQTLKLCPALYKAISLEADIARILENQPQDSSGYIDRLYE
jgi:hypothetical protein